MVTMNIRSFLSISSTTGAGFIPSLDAFDFSLMSFELFLRRSCGCWALDIDLAAWLLSRSRIDLIRRWISSNLCRLFWEKCPLILSTSRCGRNCCARWASKSESCKGSFSYPSSMHLKMPSPENMSLMILSMAVGLSGNIPKVRSTNLEKLLNWR